MTTYTKIFPFFHYFDGVTHFKLFIFYSFRVRILSLEVKCDRFREKMTETGVSVNVYNVMLLTFTLMQVLNLILDRQSPLCWKETNALTNTRARMQRERDRQTQKAKRITRNTTWINQLIFMVVSYAIIIQLSDYRKLISHDIVHDYRILVINKS